MRDLHYRYLRKAIGLFETIKRCDCSSFDPYDALNSDLLFAISKLFPLSGRTFIQALKLCPVNIRPLLGMSLIQNDPKAISDIVHALVNLYEFGSRRATFLALAENYATVLLASANHRAINLSWGLQFPYSTRYIASVGASNLFTTINAAFALLRLFEITHEVRYKQALESINQFLLRELGFVQIDKEQGYFRYYPGSSVPTYNVNGLVLKYLNRYRIVMHVARFDDTASSILMFIVRGQNADGSWFYTPGKKGKWVDGFHTGYILEGLLTLDVQFLHDQIRECVTNGVAFYRNHLFHDNVPKFSSHSMFPIDAQNCAQAIQTRCYLWQKEMDTVDSIDDMCMRIDNLLYCERRGYYYFQVRRFYINKIMYIRWCQTPMLLAFTHVLQTLAGPKTERVKAQLNRERP